MTNPHLQDHQHVHLPDQIRKHDPEGVQQQKQGLPQNTVLLLVHTLVC